MIRWIIGSALALAALGATDTNQMRLRRPSSPVPLSYARQQK